MDEEDPKQIQKASAQHRRDQLMKTVQHLNLQLRPPILSKIQMNSTSKIQVQNDFYRLLSGNEYQLQRILQHIFAKKDRNKSKQNQSEQYGFQEKFINGLYEGKFLEKVCEKSGLDMDILKEIFAENGMDSRPSDNIKYANEFILLKSSIIPRNMMKLLRSQEIKLLTISKKKKQDKND